MSELTRSSEEINAGVCFEHACDLPCPTCDLRKPLVIGGVILEDDHQLCDERIKELELALTRIITNDKTVYDHRGRRAPNRDGQLNPTVGCRWATPREIASAALLPKATS